MSPFHSSLIFLAATAGLASAASITVTNPSFQADSFPDFPGYFGGGNPAAITGWAAVGGAGVNTTPANSPFADNGAYPDGNQVAFIQGAGNLSQGLSGFTPGQQYWFQGYANSRLGDSDDPVVGVTFAGNTLLPDTLLVPVGGGNPYYRISIPFTPTAASGSLVISSRANVGGDAAVVLDGITVIQRDASEVVVYNPSFEASGTNIGGVGYLGNIAGWTLNNNGGAGNMGINQIGGPFNDTGFVPEGLNFLLLQNNSSASQNLTGLTIGQLYQLDVSYAGRGCCSPEDPTALITIGGLTAFSGTVGPAQQTLSFQFTATSTSALLSLGNQGIGADTTLFFDDVHLRAIPEPSAALLGLMALGGVLARRRR